MNLIKSFKIGYCPLKSGDSFGELALITDQPRIATVKCIKDTHFAVIKKEDYQRIYGKLQQAKIDQKVELLKKIPCLSTWGRNTIGRISLFL